jgi:hypothetical protein
MLIQAKRGTANFSFKVLARLDELEKEAGIKIVLELQLNAIEEAAAAAAKGIDAAGGERERVFDAVLNDRLAEISALHELMARKLADLKADISTKKGNKK